MAEPVLVLGGTHEAVALVRALANDAQIRTVYSLAGRTRDPVPVPGEVRRGGFGGPDGLAEYLAREGIRVVVDATHPYASAISRHAALACERTGAARLVLERAAWTPCAGDRWIEADDAASAASALPDTARRVFLTVGSRDLAPFAAIPAVDFLVRAVEPPAMDLPRDRFEVILARGPFDVAAERGLLESRAVDVLVSKNAGGPATYPKIEAARALAIPVVMIRRPEPVPGNRVGGVGPARAWVRSRAG